MFLPQTTVRNRINCTGIGLHSGETVRMCLRPAPAMTGILFVRTDVRDRDPKVPARYDLVTDTMLGTTICNADGVSVATVEHLLSALAGCGVDNLIVELDGPEVPIMDGSAAPFVFLVEAAGLRDLGAPRRAVRVLKIVEVCDGDKRVTLSPSDTSEIAFEIDFASPVIAHQSLTVDLGLGDFRHQVARARTFGFAPEVEYLRSRGLARGGSLDNAIVIDGDQVLNEGGLRFSDEFVRHKILDAIGDLYLAGGPFLGRYDGLRAGHALNNRALRALFADETAYEIVDMTAPKVAPEMAPLPRVAFA